LPAVSWDGQDAIHDTSADNSRTVTVEADTVAREISLGRGRRDPFQKKFAVDLGAFR